MVKVDRGGRITGVIIVWKRNRRHRGERDADAGQANAEAIDDAIERDIAIEVEAFAGATVAVSI